MGKRDTRAARICFWAGLLCVLASQSAKAGDDPWHLIELRDVTLGYKDYFPGGADPLLTQNGLPDRTLGKEVELWVSSDLGRFFYFDNRIHGASDQLLDSTRGQFRSVGWQFWLGLRLFTLQNGAGASIEVEHHSEHVLDQARPERFPVRDSVGFKLFLYRRPTPSRSLF